MVDDELRARGRRGHPGAMKVIGLTGGIGMGKSTAANTFSRLHVPVFDADAAVHALQAPGGRAVAPIAAAFPGTVRDGRVDREALRQAVLGKPEAMRRLERIVHPLVRDAERRFLATARRRAERLVVLDIPLLFETKGEGRCDLVVVVTAPAAVQRWRVLRRPGHDAGPAALHPVAADAGPREAPPRRPGGAFRPVPAHGAAGDPQSGQGVARMRQLVLDTETTGLDPATGDRVIEIAAIEIVNLIPTGEAYHALLDPERDVPPESTKVHGFTRRCCRASRNSPPSSRISSASSAPTRSSRTTRPSISASWMPSWSRPAAAAGPRRAWSTAWRWRRSASPACRTAWMRSAAGSASITRCAPATTRCST